MPCYNACVAGQCGGYRRGTSAPLPATLLWTRHLTGPHQPAPASTSTRDTATQTPDTEKLWATVSPNAEMECGL